MAVKCLYKVWDNYGHDVRVYEENNRYYLVDCTEHHTIILAEFKNSATAQLFMNNMHGLLKD